MTELEELILDGVLRNEPFICVHDGFAYFLGQCSSGLFDWNDAMDGCKSLGDDWELPSTEILTMCTAKNFLIEGQWYWSSSFSYEDNVYKRSWLHSSNSRIAALHAFHAHVLPVRKIAFNAR